MRQAIARFTVSDATAYGFTSAFGGGIADIAGLPPHRQCRTVFSSMCKLPVWSKCDGFVNRFAAGGGRTSTAHTASTVRLDFMAAHGVGGVVGALVVKRRANALLCARRFASVESTMRRSGRCVVPSGAGSTES
jgi:hypothetical protein